MAEPSTNGGSPTNKKSKQFWSKFNDSPTKEAMMLNPKAADIDPFERPEILGYLPLIKGRDVVELAAGIGRFTGDLADKEASSVKAYDFIQGLCDENAKVNKAKTNVEVHCEDVNFMELPEGSVDVVFSNWLFMYLDDAEVSRAFSKIASWLRPGGHFFLRESCDKPSCDHFVKEENPTKYRTKEDYDILLKKAMEGFTVEKQGMVKAYVEIQGIQTQKYWLLVKPGNKSFGWCPCLAR